MPLPFFSILLFLWWIAPLVSWEALWATVQALVHVRIKVAYGGRYLICRMAFICFEKFAVCYPAKSSFFFVFMFHSFFFRLCLCFCFLFLFFFSSLVAARSLGGVCLCRWGGDEEICWGDEEVGGREASGGGAYG